MEPKKWLIHSSENLAEHTIFSVAGIAEKILQDQVGPTAVAQVSRVTGIGVRDPIRSLWTLILYQLGRPR